MIFDKKSFIEFLKRLKKIEQVGKGQNGKDGAQGPAGANGADGAQGPAGTNGADGAQGPAGTNGADGAQGPQGAQGLQGLQGLQGIQGPAGADGLDGADGADGIGTASSVGSLVSSLTAKTTPVDADMIGIMDSAASNIWKKLSWANIKATLKTYFDTLYPTVTLQAWQAVTFQNSWVNYGAPFNSAGYMKDPLGFVHLKGMVKSGTVAYQTPVYTLPVGYRPGATYLIAVVGSSSAFAEIAIEANGVVSVVLGSNLYINLENICFRAEN